MNQLCSIVRGLVDLLGPVLMQAMLLANPCCYHHHHHPLPHRPLMERMIFLSPSISLVWSSQKMVYPFFEFIVMEPEDGVSLFSSTDCSVVWLLPFPLPLPFPEVGKFSWLRSCSKKFKTVTPKLAMKFLMVRRTWIALGLFRFLFPQDPTLEFSSPSLPSYRFDIDSISISRYDPMSMLNRPLRRGGRGGF